LNKEEINNPVYKYFNASTEVVNNTILELTC